MSDLKWYEEKDLHYLLYKEKIMAQFSKDDTICYTPIFKAKGEFLYEYKLSNDEKKLLIIRRLRRDMLKVIKEAGELVDFTLDWERLQEREFDKEIFKKITGRVD